jgi:hypothetical protein
MASLLRIFLAVVLIGAAVGKITDRNGFLRTLVTIPWISVRRARALAHLVPATELVVAVGLVASSRYGGIAAVVLLAGFTSVIATELAAGRRFVCACFGQSAPTTAGGMTLARNLALAAAAAVVAVAGDAYEPSAALAGAGAAMAFLAAEAGMATWRVRLR